MLELVLPRSSSSLALEFVVGFSALVVGVAVGGALGLVAHFLVSILRLRLVFSPSVLLVPVVKGRLLVSVTYHVHAHACSKSGSVPKCKCTKSKKFLMRDTDTVEIESAKHQADLKKEIKLSIIRLVVRATA